MSLSTVCPRRVHYDRLLTRFLRPLTSITATATAIMAAAPAAIAQRGRLPPVEPVDVTVTDKANESDNVPLVADTVAVYAPSGVVLEVEIVRVELADPSAENWMLVGFKLTTGPVGKTEAVKLTLPTNPPRLVTVIVEDVIEPCTSAREDGLDANPKSWTTNLPNIVIGCTEQ